MPRFNIYVGQYQNSKNCWEVADRLRKLGYHPELVDIGYCLTFKVHSGNDYNEAYDVWFKLNSKGFEVQSIGE